MRFELIQSDIYPEQNDPQKVLEGWKLEAQDRGLSPIEFLLPRLEVKNVDHTQEFDFLGRSLKMESLEFGVALHDLGVWTYHVASSGYDSRLSGTYTEKTIDFHRYRNQIIFHALEFFLGDHFAEFSLVDLGCNSGFFSLEAASKGFGKVKGIDLREENIAQAKFLAKAFGLDEVEFEIGNLKDLISTQHKYDVILNLGIMYHLSQPFEILKKCYDLTSKICVIDTITHKEKFSGYHLAIKDSTISIEGDLAFELQPTYRGIIESIYSAGFGRIVEIVSDDCKGVELYRDYSRRLFFAFKE